MLTLSLLLAFPVQDDAKVTLDLPISPLPAVFKHLQDQTGYGYQVNGPNRNQQIFVRVKDMPSAKLREAIAKVTDGTWSQAGGVWSLNTKNEVSVQDAAFRKSITAWFAKQKPVQAIDRAGLEATLKRSAELAKQAENDSKKMTELQALGRQAPKSRLISRLILGIGLNEVLSLGSKERRVYAFNPTSLQRPLPGNAAAALNEFKREHAEYMDSVSRLFPANLDDDIDFNGWNPLIDPYRHEGKKPPAATLMFAIKRNRGSVSYELMVFDAKGARTDSEGGAFGPEFDDMMEGQEPNEMFHQGLVDLKMPVALKDEDKIFAKDLKDHIFGNLMGTDQTPEPVSKITIDRLLNMDKVDPLTFGPTQMLQQFADVKKKQVVAKVTDLAIFSVALGLDMDQDPTLSTAITLSLGGLMKGSDGYEESEDLVTLKPSQSQMMPFPIEMDRQATARFLRSVASDADMLETISSLAASVDEAEDIQLPILLSMLFSGDAGQFFADQHFDLLKLYGQLNPAQKNIARQNGLTLALSTMVGPMAQHTRQMLLSGNQGNSMPSEMPASVPDSEDDSSISSFDYYGGSYNDEITVKLANVPASSGRVTVKLTSKEELFILSGATRFGGSQVANPSTVAYYMVYSEQNPNVSYMKVNGFSYGTQQTLGVTFSFGNAPVQSSSMEIPKVAKNAKPLKLNDLPSEFQKQVQEFMVSYRKDMQIPPTGGSGGAAKPPAE